MQLKSQRRRQRRQCLLPRSATTSFPQSATTTASKREFSLADEKDYTTKKQPNRVTKKSVSYCDTSDPEEFESFKKKANTTNSNSDEFELGPEADTSNSD